MDRIVDATVAAGPEAAPALGPARLEWADVARGLGMILVITGHAIPKAIVPAGMRQSVHAFQFPVGTVYHWIYSFHMPLFFFISGVLIKHDTRDLPWRQVVAKAARSLLLPYIFFGLIAYMAWVLLLRHFGHHGGNSPSMLYPLLGLFYGVYGSPLQYLDAPLWFFPCLFCTLVLARCLPKGTVAEGIAVVLVFAAGVALVKLCPRRLPWGSDIACLALLFLYAGRQLRPWLLGMSARARLKCLLGVPFLLLLHEVSFRCNAPVDLGSGLVGAPALFLLEAFSGTLATIFISFYLPYPFLGSLLGRNTIIIFPLHLFCLTAITGVLTAVPAFRSLAFLGLITLLIYVIGTCLSFIVIVPLMKACFPWLFPTPKLQRQPA